MYINPLDRPNRQPEKPSKTRSKEETKPSFEDSISSIFGVDAVEVVKHELEDKPEQDTKQQNKHAKNRSSDEKSGGLNIKA